MARTVRYAGKLLDAALGADVVVCGGGSAGVAAAVSAARAGASVALIEQIGCLGGLGTAGLVPCLCPYTDGEKVIVRGVGEEILQELARRMGVPVEYDWFNIHAETMKCVYDDMLVSSGVELRYFTKIVDVVGEGRVDAVVISTHEGLKAVAGKVFVEATGDGDVAAWAGAHFEAGDDRGRMQSPTLCNVFAGVDWEEFWKHKKAGNMRPDQEIWRRQVEQKRAPMDEAYLAVGVLPSGDSIGASNMGHVYGVNGLDEENLTLGIIKGRKMSWRFLEWYRENVPGFRKAELAATGAILGVRETRRILGDYVLGLEDYKAQAVFEDEIGRFAYPVDLHAATGEVDEQEEMRQLVFDTKLAPGESYGIPYGCLVPDGLENVLVAGRCVSTDRAVQGSLRVMPGCFVTGQGAGAGAALAARGEDGNVRGVDTDELRGVLRSQGAYIP